MLTPEQLMAAHKANLETLLGLTHKAFEGVEKLVDLNLQLARTTLAEAGDSTQAALSAKDAQELLALQAQLLQPAAEKAAAYSRQLYDIAASTNAEVLKFAQTPMGDVQRGLESLMDAAGKNAPQGTEGMVTLMRSAVSAANSAFEQVHKATRQAAELSEANMKALLQGASALMPTGTSSPPPESAPAAKPTRSTRKR